MIKLPKQTFAEKKLLEAKNAVRLAIRAITRRPDADNSVAEQLQWLLDNMDESIGRGRGVSVGRWNRGRPHDSTMPRVLMYRHSDCSFAIGSYDRKDQWEPFVPDYWCILNAPRGASNLETSGAETE